MSAGGEGATPRTISATRGWACAHHPFEAHAASTPDAPAVSGGGRAATYAQVERTARAVAARLRALGVGPERRVVVLMEPGPAFAAALIGVLKAGGAYVPIDPEYPAERIAFVLEDSGAAAVLTHGDAAHRLPPTHLPVLDVEAIDPAAGGGFVAAEVDPDNLAYVIYTSGSTGRPKGVGVTHRALVSLQRVTTNLWGLAPGDRVGQLPSVGFDMSVEPIWAAWAAGAALLFRPRSVPALGPGFWRWVADERISILNPPTALWHAWVADMAASGARVPESVRLLVTGGEKPQAAALARWREIAPGVRWMNCYGPTEATVWATSWELPADGWQGDAPIGSARANARAYVVGEDGSQAAEGEVCIGGVCVARGYLGRAALTAEKFVPDPFAEAPGARMYRTGDRARWTEAHPGSSRAEPTFALSHSRTFALLFLGRIDNQVKVGGFRVEPGEVEAVLSEHPDVAAAAVAARRGEDGAMRLHAWAVLRDDAADGDAGALRGWLGERLPAYMVPSTLTFLDSLPLNANGKIDRRALPTPASASPESPDLPAGLGETARGVMEIFREVLGAAVGPDDDFFAAGGHSLLGMLVLSRVRRRWGVELPVSAVFDARTAAALAERIDAAAGTETAGEPPLAPIARDGAPLLPSFQQQGLWLLHEMEPAGFAAYNIPLAVRLSGALDASALRRALAGIVRRHEALRTVFATTADGLAQVVNPPADDFDLPLDDFSALPRDAAEAEARRVSEAVAAEPFDLAAGPMLRGRLARIAPDEHLLALNVHHIAADGWSLGILFGELSKLYEAIVSGRPSPLPPLPLQYADFAAWQRARLTDEVRAAQLDYWRARLDGAPGVLDLPTDRPRPASPSHEGGIVRFTVPATLAARLREAARRHAATPFMVLLAGFDLLLHRLGAGDDLVVGSPVAGRARPETEGLIGFFINTVALRAELRGDPTIGELIGRVREATLGAYANQELPFESVIEALNPQRVPGVTPFFQVSFAMGNVEMDPVDLGGVRARPEDVYSGSTKADLFLEIRESGGALHGDLEYAARLWEPATAERIVALYLRLLEAVAGDADLPLSAAIARVDEPRARAEAEAWNRTARPYPRESTIHAEFAAVAASRADAVALRWDGGEMTYGALDERSSRLANHLRRHGVRVDQPVAVLLPRGPEMVIAFLAVLKAGGAYVPLNPQYPASRNALMLEDCGARVLVTAEGTIEGTRDRGQGTGGIGHDRVTVVRVDADAGAIAAESADAPSVAVDAENAAYVIYTSGSTGRPKGVVVPHRAVLRLVMNGGFAEMGAGETWLQMVPASFDVSTFEVWGPLLNGARMALYPAGTPDPAAVGAFIRRHGVTSAWMTSALFHQVVDQDLAAFAPLRQLMSGGDVVSAPHAARVMEAHPALRVINGYGPTENTTYSTCHTLEPGDAELVSIPIGTPISNSTAYVLDAEMRPVPACVPGELYVGGDGLARGYLNAPALTAERYLPNPFAADGSRLYRTGDRVRRRADGVLEFLGRLDQQVKIRGHRTEPGELESLLARHPAVADAVVTVREAAPGDRQLVAHVVPARGYEGVAAELPARLREHARGAVPEHMVPVAVVVMDALPLTANGKVDRRALPAPKLGGDAAATGAEPQTATERLLAATWAELLGVEQVPADASFFEIGGHSLLAAQMAARVREEFGVPLSLPQVLAAPTVSALGALLDAEMAALRAELEAELSMLTDEEVRALLEAEEAWDGTAAAGD
ncbi:non-ribosomal peptide synthetase [Longimicrobium sp.]|uniref:non-ribosomal peptide synthetase n=1 Tax=Longimicrobium sp. TaxID=2029185 RepID=UPI002C1FDFC3|nr:non-ribosomal peptide synthetase [Longimicrobium sp.]HSU14721.1 amino acid adenylation domain-containing protein [Longimicrobium sp.]